MASVRFLVRCVPKAEFTKVQLGPVDHHGQWEWWEIPDEDGKNMKNLTKSFTMHQSPIRQIALCQHFWLLFSKIHLINFKPWNPKNLFMFHLQLSGVRILHVNILHLHVQEFLVDSPLTSGHELAGAEPGCWRNCARISMGFDNAWLVNPFVKPTIGAHVMNIVAGLLIAITWCVLAPAIWFLLF